MFTDRDRYYFRRVRPLLLLFLFHLTIRVIPRVRRKCPSGEIIRRTRGPVSNERVRPQ